MLRPDQMEASMSGVRDQILAAMDDHERNVHHGEPCMGNRASTVAFLAHCLGVRGEARNLAQELLLEYDARCVQGQCEHGGHR